ncbi:hypothetical protein DAEQUDRAFT_680609, partial [Daedalea quercina L-15889]
CWLVNLSGKKDGFMPIDRGMEAAIKDIKVTHRAQGPSVDWKYLKKLHPTIPVIRAISEHIEDQFGTTWTKYKKHTNSPDKAGIRRLQAAYLAPLGIFSRQPGRQLRPGNIFNNFTYDALQRLGKTMGRWLDNRTFVRSKAEEFDTLIQQNTSAPMNVD